jgi:hypothetical protein
MNLITKQTRILELICTYTVVVVSCATTVEVRVVVMAVSVSVNKIGAGVTVTVGCISPKIPEAVFASRRLIRASIDLGTTIFPAAVHATVSVLVTLVSVYLWITMVTMSLSVEVVVDRGGVTKIVLVVEAVGEVTITWDEVAVSVGVVVVVIIVALATKVSYLKKIYLDRVYILGVTDIVELGAAAVYVLGP